MMSNKLANTAPGYDSSPIKAGGAVYLGFKSDNQAVVLSTVSTEMAFSNIVFNSDLPENGNLNVVVESVEHRRPIGPTVSRVFTSNTVVLTRNSGTGNAQGIYEISSPIDPGSSLLASVRFIVHPTTWHGMIADWAAGTNVQPPYLGLENGIFNTGIFAFLCDEGLSIGGPLQSFGTSRPGAAFLTWNWKALAEGSVVELYFGFNLYTNPYQVEIWKRDPSDTYPVPLGAVAISALGTFPSDPLWQNSRSGPSEMATLYFGNAANTAGDAVEVVDWALYPDYREAIIAGNATTDIDLELVADLPITYSAASNKLPTVGPGRWFASGGASSSLTYQPGQRSSAFAAKVPKNGGSGMTGFYREEPVITQISDGAMIEAFMSVTERQADGHALGFGIGVDDGVNFYRLLAVDSGTHKTYGLLKSETQYANVDTGYTIPTVDQDWSSPKLVRLWVDWARGAVKAFLVDEDTPVLSLPISEPDPGFPASLNAGIAKLWFGSLVSGSPSADGNFSFVNYCSNYKSWESSDHALPTVGSIYVAETLSDFSGSFTLESDGSLLISKESFNTAGSYRFYNGTGPDTLPLDARKGVQVDFRCKVVDYKNSNGRLLSPNTALGCGITVYLANQELVVGFYDCGIYGRKIGVLAHGATDADIINQTELGKAVSASWDWTQMSTFRIVHQPYNYIKIWGGTVLGDPLISINWVDATTGFNLPALVGAPVTNGVAFGHFSGDTASSTLWEYVRFGGSSGYDVSIEQVYDGVTPPASASGGRVLLLANFTAS
jgi:hypothetical protein